MSWKSLSCVTVFCALLAGQALAQPSVNVTGMANGGNIDWTVEVSHDAALHAAGNESFALELALEFEGALVGTPTVDANWMETIDGVDIINPGNNPYTGNITEGVLTYGDVASQTGQAGNVNAIFAALGSTDFASAGTYTAMTFTTEGTSGTVWWDGIVAQAGIEDVMGMANVGADLPAGDFSGDGAVDGADLSLLLGNWGAAVPPTPNGWDGVAPTSPQVDADELSALLGTWGEGVGGAALAVAPAAVPEPASVLSGLFGVAGLALVARRRMR